MAIALTVAGSDSGGGAGIQADLKTFDRLGVHGVSAIACLTAQNPFRVLGIEPCSPKMLGRQLEAIFEELPPAAAKTGMLYSSALIQVAAGFFQRHPIPLVVDPVMISTSGARLLQGPALSRLQDEIFPLASVLTPNLSEAELLVQGRIRSVPDLREAARKIQGDFGCAVVVKGGHLRGAREAVDVFRDRTGELILRAPFVRGMRTHGTGCTFSAAITAYLALGRSLRQAVTSAKQHITAAIRHSRRIGRYSVLGSGRSD
ncbi:MAG TPA: bifunctional hydroxymethylpyrimidine kinase/phosphomethylpyrimidine kinase [Methylomirabilota bacterium]|nr:bifunctional hydroxymethylpyrimidine kinase/phosphomethylpyrimidine kinase [Methylomirabilota bacterium]